MKEAAPPPPPHLRNVTSAEILEILDGKNFGPPDSTIDRKTWDETVRKVRKVVKELDLDLALKSNPRTQMRHDVCGAVDNLVAERKKPEELALIRDDAVSIMRSEIANRLRIRMILGTHPDFPKLIAHTKKMNGILRKEELISVTSNVFVSRMNYCAIQFGDTLERRRIGYEYIADFFSEQTGIPVHFENLELREYRPISRGGAEAGADGKTKHRREKKEPGPLGDLEIQAQELMEAKELFREALGNFLLELGAKASSIGQEIEDLGRQKASLISELGPINAELAPIEELKREIDRAAEALRKALVVTRTRRDPKIDTHTIQIPDSQRKTFECQKRGLEAAAQDKYEEKAKLEREIEALEAKIQALTALRSLLPTHQQRLSQVLEILARITMLPTDAPATQIQAAAALAAAPPPPPPAPSSAPAAGRAANIDEEGEIVVPEKITLLAELDILSRRGRGLKLQATATRENHPTLSGAHVKKGGLTIGTVVHFELARVRGQLALKSLMNDVANVIPLATDAAVARLGLSVITQTSATPARAAGRGR